MVGISDSHRRVCDRVRRWAETWPNVRAGLALTGIAGSGKTHLAVALLQRIVVERQATRRARFVFLPQLMREIQASWKDPDRTEEAILAEVCGVELLVLDQLGAEASGAWVQERVEHILTRCFDGGGSLVTTSIYPIEPAGAGMALDERTSGSVVSLLKEACRVVKMPEDDYRDTVLKHGQDL